MHYPNPPAIAVTINNHKQISETDNLMVYLPYRLAVRTIVQMLNFQKRHSNVHDCVLKFYKRFYLINYQFLPESVGTCCHFKRISYRLAYWYIREFCRPVRKSCGSRILNFSLKIELLNKNIFWKQISNWSYLHFIGQLQVTFES